MMVKEVRTLRRKVAEALNESKLPPVVAQLVLDSVRTELERIVQMQEAAEAASAAVALVAAVEAAAVSAAAEAADAADKADLAVDSEARHPDRRAITEAADSGKAWLSAACSTTAEAAEADIDRRATTIKITTAAALAA